VSLKLDEQILEFLYGEEQSGPQARFVRWAFRGRLFRWAIIRLWPSLLALRARFLPRRRVLFVGQAYYNHWYLSRALRRLGWKADLLNWDGSEIGQMHYHGEDYRFRYHGEGFLEEQLRFYRAAILDYDIFHFANAHGISFSYSLSSLFRGLYGDHSEIHFLKRLGKKIVYTNNGCLDGVSQTSFSKWGPEPVCEICPWKSVPAVCSDERNLTWGRFRNEVADLQCTLGGNRADFNDDPRVHEVPEVYCLDPDFWRPDLGIPADYKLPVPSGTVALYHAVGNAASRTDDQGVNIKSSHIYLPLVKRLQQEGRAVQLLEFTNIPNKVIRFYQAQMDICLDMLTFGWFGATAREAMMLGKPVICFLRPEWLDSMRKEIPDYVDELPVVSATPSTVYDVLCDLLDNREKRKEIGRRSRAFAVKWHSALVAAERFDEIYRCLLRGRTWSRT
jgi:hypothetical protein